MVAGTIGFVPMLLGAKAQKVMSDDERKNGTGDRFTASLCRPTFPEPEASVEPVWHLSFCVATNGAYKRLSKKKKTTTTPDQKLLRDFMSPFLKQDQE